MNKECPLCQSGGIKCIDATPWGRMVEMTDGFKEFVFVETIDMCPTRKQIERTVGEADFVKLIVDLRTKI